YKFYTTFELNQVKYDKINKALSAKNGSGETVKSSTIDLNTKREKVESYKMLKWIWMNLFPERDIYDELKLHRELKAHRANHLVERSPLSVIDVPVVLALSALERPFCIKILESVRLGSW
ncbi:46517_t:CDS:2, partial [Gigaspora margarita]